MASSPVHFTVAVTAVNNFTGLVQLATIGLPAGFTSKFSPSSTCLGPPGATCSNGSAATPPFNADVTVTAGSGAGNISVVATGTSGALVHSASSPLAVQDFTFSLSPAYPSPIIVPPNSQATVTAFTSGLNGFGQPGQTITLSYYPVTVGGLPACSTPGADWTNSYSSITSVVPGQGATLSIASGNSSQYYCTFEVIGSYGQDQHILNGYFVQQGAGGFVLTQPSQQAVPPGQTASFPAPYTPFSGFTGAVAYNVSGNIPTGASIGFSPLNSPQQGDALSVYVPPGVLAGTYQMYITATGPNGCSPPSTGSSNGCVSQTVGAQLVVQTGQGFSITATPITSTVVAPGGTAQYNISVNSAGGYTGAVNLGTSGLPANASVSLSSYSVQAGGAPVTLTISTTANTPLGAYSITVAATSGSVSQYGPAPLTVTLPSAAGILTPSPGANLAGGNTVFTWNAGLGATQYTITATAANGQTSSATTGTGQLSATLSLPASNQTATVTLQTTTASGVLTQTYAYTIQPPGTAQSLTMAPGNPVAVVPANGQEVLYTFLFANPSGGARPSPQDIGDCTSTEVAIQIRIAQLTGSTATLGFTAPPGTQAAAFDWGCDDGGGSGSGGGGTGSTGDPSPNIDSVSPVPLLAGTTTTITINGEYFGSSAGYLDFEGGSSQVGNASWTPDGTTITVSVSVGPSASGYCTVAVDASVDDAGNSFAPADGSSPDSEPFDIPIENSAVSGVSVTITSRPITITPSSTTSGQYVATLTSIATPPGGVYTWTTNNTGMVNFTSPASGTNASQVTLGIMSTNGAATITLTYLAPGGGNAVDSFTFALTNDTVVVAWVNGQAVVPDTSQLPLGIADPYVLALANPLTCFPALLGWSYLGSVMGAGNGGGLMTSAEISYANQFLISRSGNPAPPATMTNNAAFVQAQNYRMYQRLQTSYEIVHGVINQGSIRYLSPQHSGSGNNSGALHRGPTIFPARPTKPDRRKAGPFIRRLARLSDQ